MTAQQAKAKRRQAMHDPRYKSRGASPETKALRRARAAAKAAREGRSFGGKPGKK